MAFVNCGVDGWMGEGKEFLMALMDVKHELLCLWLDRVPYLPTSNRKICLPISLYVNSCKECTSFCITTISTD